MILKLDWENNFIILSIFVLMIDLTQADIAAQPSVRYPVKHCIYSTVYSQWEDELCTMLYSTS